MSVVDLLDTARPKSELRIALDVLREFKQSHTIEEDFSCTFAGWVKLEQLQEFLEYLVEDYPLRDDTVAYRDKVKGVT